jgi:hypothetical protein
MYYYRFNLKSTKFFKCMNPELIELAPWTPIELPLKKYINKINNIWISLINRLNKK